MLQLNESRKSGERTGAYLMDRGCIDPGADLIAHQR